MQGIQKVWLHNPGRGDLLVRLQGFPAVFWIVVKPKGEEQLGDICYETNIIGLAGLYRGWLNESNIFGVYTNHAEAERIANELLSGREDP
jgi:hypothetical protein